MTSIALPAPSAAARDGRLATLGRATVHIAASFPIATVVFTAVVTALSLALGLLVLIIGLPVALGALLLTRGFADVERRRAAWMLREPVRRPAADRPARTGLLGRLHDAVADGMTWREIAHALLMFPVATAAWSVWVSLWAVGLGYATGPAWVWALGENDSNIDLGPLDPHTTGEAFASMPVGFGVLAIAVVATPLMGRGLAKMTKALLS